jgi:hypothetical protein
LQNIPLFDDLAVGIEAENINASRFMASQVQVTHMHEGQIAIDADALHLAGNAPHLLDVAAYAVGPVWKEGIVLDVWTGHEIPQQVGLTLVKDFAVYDVQRPLDSVSCNGRRLSRYVSAF